MSNNIIRRYSPASQVIHWTSVLLIGFAWALGSFGDELPRGSIRELGEFLHVSMGQLLVVLLLLRIAWRAVSPPPPLKTSAGDWADRGASAMHVLLYILLAAIPIAGVMTLFAGGEALPLFGLGEIPSPWMRDKDFRHDVKEVHEALANALMVLATVHAGAALVHHFYFKDNTLLRMMPRMSDAQS